MKILILIYWGTLVLVSAILGILATVIALHITNSPPWWAAIIAGGINGVTAIVIAEAITRKLARHSA